MLLRMAGGRNWSEKSKAQGPASLVGSHTLKETGIVTGTVHDQVLDVVILDSQWPWSGCQGTRPTRVEVGS